MEDIIKNCISIFLETRNKKVAIDKSMIRWFLEKDNKEKNELIVRFILKEDCSWDNLILEEIMIWKKIQYYYNLFLDECKKGNIDQFVAESISFSLAKGLVELHIKESFFDDKNPLPNDLNCIEKEIELDYDSKDYLINLGMVQDVFCKKEKDFLRISDKLMNDDLIRNIDVFCEININAFIMTIERIKAFKNMKVAKIFAHCLVTDIIRSSTYHFGILKEPIEDLGF